jgi:hypothetical protein
MSDFKEVVLEWSSFTGHQKKTLRTPGTYTHAAQILAKSIYRKFPDRRENWPLRLVLNWDNRLLAFEVTLIPPKNVLIANKKLVVSELHPRHVRGEDEGWVRDVMGGLR